MTIRIAVNASLLLSLVLATAGPTTARSQAIKSGHSVSASGAGWTADAGIGVLFGKAQEFVYNPDGSTLSRLDWSMDNDAVFTGGFTLKPLKGFAIGIKGSTNLSDGATNDDYDFNLPVGDCPPLASPTNECHSHSGSLLRNADSFDAFVSGKVIDAPSFGLAGVAGYKFDFYQWQAYGGSYNYGPNSPAYDPLWPGLGISYQQTWRTPYLGLEASGSSGNFSWNGRAIGSLWVDGSARDQHQLGFFGVSTIYSDKFKISRMFELSLGGGYYLGKGVSVTANYTLKDYLTAKGDETANLGGILDLGNCGYSCAGGNNLSQIIMVGLSVDLDKDKDGAKHTARGHASWTGPYAGVSAGEAWQSAKWTLNDIDYPLSGGAFPPFDPTTTPASFDAKGPNISGFAGYGAQFGNAVLGFEADIGHWNLSHFQSGIPGTQVFQNFFVTAPLGLTSDATSVTSDWHGSLRLRGGWLATPDVQIYGTGGLAVVDVTARASCTNSGVISSACAFNFPFGVDGDVSQTSLRFGWTAGGGVEANLGDGWFARAAYNYTDAGSLKFSPQFHDLLFGPVVFDSKIALKYQEADIGIGYRF